MAASTAHASTSTASAGSPSFTARTAARAPGAGPGVSPSAGWTEHIVTAEPCRRLLAVDGLITGLHEPRSSHLRMLAAFAPTDLLSRCYEAAIDRGYLWHEFGDLHLLLP